LWPEPCDRLYDWREVILQVNKSTVLLALGFLLPTIGVILFLTIFPLLNILGILLAFGGLAALVAGKVLETSRSAEGLAPVLEKEELLARTMLTPEQELVRLRHIEGRFSELILRVDELVGIITENPSLLQQIKSDQEKALDIFEEVASILGEAERRQ